MLRYDEALEWLVYATKSRPKTNCQRGEWCRRPPSKQCQPARWAGSTNSRQAMGQLLQWLALPRASLVSVYSGQREVTYKPGLVQPWHGQCPADWSSLIITSIIEQDSPKHQHVVYHNLPSPLYHTTPIIRTSRARQYYLTGTYLRLEAVILEVYSYTSKQMSL